MQGVVTKAVVVAAMIGLAAAGKPTAALAADFDGNWTVNVITEKGTCDRSYSYKVRVAQGHVLFTSESSITVNGTVLPDGAVKVSIRRKDQGANGTGRLSGRAGIGGWHGFGKNGSCSGHWEAVR
jgi:hypothetical protein